MPKVSFALFSLTLVLHGLAGSVNSASIMMEVSATFSVWLLFLLMTAVTGVIKKQPRQDWVKIAREEIERAKNNRPIVGEAKNTILFLGDGMGISSNTASRIYYAQKEGKSFRDSRFSFEKMPYAALAMTYSTDTMVTESATAATSYLCGVKGREKTIGVTEDVIYGRCETELEANKVKSSLWHCAQAGKSTGFVTTTRVTHASPAATYTQTASRDWESDGLQPVDVRGKCKDIALQLVENGDFLQVMMGGGRKHFFPNTTNDPEYPSVKGTRQDGRDLIQMWKDKQPDGERYEYVERLEDFQKIDPQKVDRLLALFEPSHLHYEVNRRNTTLNKWAEPSLTEMVEMAIKILRKNEKGFCLFAESGRIDHAHHDAKAFKAITDTVEFSNAVAKGLEMTDIKDTLTVVSADHGLPITMNGDTGINTDILGLGTEIVNGTSEQVEIAKDGLPYGVLMYTNGPYQSFDYHNTNGSTEFPNKYRRNLTQDVESGKAFEKEYLQFTAVPLTYTSHSGEEVAIYAQGPMAHLFHSVHENNHIAHVMMYATCVGPYREDCARDDAHKQKWPVDPAAKISSASVITPKSYFVSFVLFCLITAMKA